MDDAPRALRDPEERARRLKLLDAPHMQPLTALVEGLRANTGDMHRIPYFDPCDGGVEASVLFLLESPGPQAVASGFISRNNNDQSAQAMCEDLLGAGLTRRQTILWNAVPWALTDAHGRARKPTSEELGEAEPWTQRTLSVLKHLQVIVLMGQSAARLHRYIRMLSDLPMVIMHHPSPRVYNTSPERREENRRLLARVQEMVQ